MQTRCQWADDLSNEAMACTDCHQVYQRGHTCAAAPALPRTSRSILFAAAVFPYPARAAVPVISP